MKANALRRLLILAVLACLVLGTVFTTAYAADNAPDANQAANIKMDIVANNVSYSDSLYILYAISNEGFDRAQHEIKMLFWDEARESYALGTEKYAVTNSGKAKVKGKDCLIFYTNGIAAKEMTDDIYARACVVIDGAEYYTDVMKFSVLEYVHTMQEQGNVGNGQIKLFTSMLDYGTAAQNSFGHNTSRPANGKYYKINANGGKLPDGFEHGRFLAGEKVTVTANAPAPGMRFSHWLDENGILVSFDKEMEITVDSKNKEYTAVYKDISNVVAQLMLKAEIPYNGDLEDVDLPTAVTFEVGGSTVTLEVTWDTEGFVLGSIGKQSLYAELTDTAAYAQYGIEPGSIVLEVTTLPFAYELDPNNGEYVITGYYGDAASVTLPSTYKNTYITRIATRAFNGVMTLREVVIPSTITKIDNGAFFYCDNIEKMTVPFVGESATSANSWFGWIFGAAQYDTQHGMLPLRLKAVTLADGATSVPRYAFYKCAQITAFDLPDSVRRIDYGAFGYCAGLTELTLPASLSYFHYGFYYCSNLKKINVTNLDTLFNISYTTSSSNSGLLCNGTALYCNGKLVTEVTIPNGITKINHMLSGCTSIEKITVPASVTELGSYVFANMSALREVVFEDPSKITEIGYGQFYNCTALTSMDLSGFTNLKTLSGSFFSGCTALTEAKLPENLTSLEGSVFQNTAIKNIVLPSGIQIIPDWCFNLCYALESVIIPNGVVEIGERAFYNCSSLRSFAMPAALTSIGEDAFANCTKLTVIDLPERLYDIGEDAFYNCSNLSQLTIRSNRLTTVGSNAFYACTKLYEIFNLSELVLTPGSTDYGCMAQYAKAIHTSLEETAQVTVDENGFMIYTDSTENLIFGYVGNATEITLPVPNNGKPTRVLFSGNGFITKLTVPAGITSINERAFYNCYNLTSVIIGSGVETIGEEAFSNCYNLTSIVIPDSVTTIGKQAFRYCRMLTSVTLGSGVETIGEDAFSHCYDLTSVVIPNSVTAIGNGAFSSCSNLTSIVIPNSVTTIGKRAFGDCRMLTSVTLGSGVETIGEDAFSNCYRLVEVINKSTLNVRAGSSENGRVAYYAKEVHTGESKLISVGDYLFYTYNGVHYLVAYTGSDTSVTLPASYNGDTYKINQYAFRDCSSLTSVTIPDSVTSIGDWAFSDCSSLTSVTIGDSVTYIGWHAFYNCSSLTSVTIPDSVTSIGSSAFYYCSSLTSVTIGNSVTSIGSYAFSDCSKLTSIVIHSKKVAFGQNVFNNCNAALFTEDDYGTYVGTVDNPYAILISVKNKNLTTYVIHEGTEFIADNVFYGCANMTSVTIPDSVTAIGDWAFAYCNSLTSVTIPDSVTSIGNYAFYGCSKLTSVTIGSDVEAIGSEAFYGCNALETVHIKNMDAWCRIAFADANANPMYYADQLLLNGEPVKHVVIPEGVTEIKYTFYGFSDLESVTIPDSVTSIGNYAFRDCTALTSVTIPDSVTSIGDYAFYGCGNLTSVTIPDSVTSIGDWAFAYCSSLTSVTIPDSVTSIGERAFYNCDSLTSVTIPDSVTSIGGYAFCYCSNLTSVHYRGTEEQWNTITKGSYWDGSTGNYTLTYNYDGE